MNLSQPFIHRPVATTLLALGLLLAGVVAFRWLPVSPLPQVDFPTILVSANLPGAGPDTMAATVATPLERTLGRNSARPCSASPAACADAAAPTRATSANSFSVACMRLEAPVPSWPEESRAGCSRLPRIARAYSVAPVK
jgi:hypothetical protein